jgi:hypothetical protein
MSRTTTLQPDQRFQGLVAAQGQQRQALTAQAVAIAASSAAGFTGWYSSEQITEWAAKLVQTLEPILRLLARTTDAYTARAVTDLTGTRLAPTGPVDVHNLRSGGITHAGAYARAADVYRWQQHQFDQIAKLATDDLPKAEQMLDLEDPIKAAIDRVTDVADTDTQLVVRAQAQQTLIAGEDKGLVTAWRRVFHPELSLHGSCGLCIAASDRIYKVSNLMPIHQRCNCIPVPITEARDAFGREDPGQGLNDADIGRLYKDAGSTGGKDLKRTRYQIDEHGELGPVLNDGTFRPRKVRESTAVNRKPLTDEERRQRVERIHAELLSYQPRVEELAYDSPQQWGKYAENLQQRIAELGRELAA